MADLNIRSGLVIGIEDENSSRQLLTVEVEGLRARAVNYLAFGDRVEVEDAVLLNTTAVDLGLGSGGWHFVLPRGGSMTGPGHIMKLRYTPLQLKVQAVEEQGSPWHDRFLDSAGLEGRVVLAAELHSMVAPLALALGALDSGARIAYVATDGGALPIAFSKAVRTLKESGVLIGVVSAGSAFGGDLEAVNVFTGLQAAGRVLNAKYIICSMGPGIAGTGTVFGFSGLEQGFVLQGAAAMGGKPVLVPRLSFADKRERHQGLSHHSVSIIRWAYGGGLWLPLPFLGGERGRRLLAQARYLPRRCIVRFAGGSFIEGIARKHPGLFICMGRDYAGDSGYFQGLGATAQVARALGGQV